MKKELVKYELATHNRKEVIFIHFEYNAALVFRVKN